MNAAQVLVNVLAAHAIDRVWCVAGESYLPVLDALHDRDDIDVVTCRHEGGAAFMALADAKLTGRPGVCLVNRGPGAMNAAIALHSADQDAAPLLLIVGHVTRADIGRRAFQEVDYGRVFADVAKGVWLVHEPAGLAEALTRALRVALAGTPGPVVLVLPEDVLYGDAPAVWAHAGAALAGAPDPAAVDEVARRLARAERPLLLAGGRLAAPGGRRALLACAQRLGLPVVVSNKHQDLFPNEHPHYAGHLTIATRAEQLALYAEADLWLAVGTRLDEVSTQRGRLLDRPRPRQPLVHVYPDPTRLGTAYETALALACDPAALLDALPAAHEPPLARAAWLARLHEHERRQAACDEDPCGDGVGLGHVAARLSRLAEDDAVVTVDAGNFTSWVHRYFRFRGEQRLLGIASSAMGFGVPAGVAAALRAPGRQTLAFVGDGGFMMTGNELCTAVDRGCRLCIVIANNFSYGTIRQHQERQYPGRVIATDLRNPDFAALAQAHGALGLSLRHEADAEDMLGRALGHHGPVVLDVHTSRERLSAYQTLGELRARASGATT